MWDAGHPQSRDHLVAVIGIIDVGGSKMPELPELDVMQEILTERSIGRTIAAVNTFHPGILKTVDPSLDSLVGKSIRAISRRGKHLIFTVADDLHLVIHLMLAGRLVLCQSDESYRLSDYVR